MVFFFIKKRGKNTWLVQTLLKVTNANVCANMAPARSFFASASGIRKALRVSCGTKARDSKRKWLVPSPGGEAEER